MTGLKMPYQCLERCGNLLVAARGSNIDLFNLSDGSFMSTWQCPKSQEDAKKFSSGQENLAKLESQDSKSSSVDIVTESVPHPAKRRRLSSGQDAAPANDNNDDDKGGKKKDKKQNKRLDYVAPSFEAPAIIALVVTSDSQHVIAITGEDKSIRVFSVVSLDGVAKLEQLSQRSMPKRPSALAITEDNTTIISADKFGDAYSLPLIPSPYPVQEEDKENRSQNAVADIKPFKPSANELTIHSQRNLKALENQKRHNKKQPKAPKPEPDFEHTLLLGHVSLLTDVKIARSGSRRYIITADRDEHIRVSRGIPQTHIIEGFCFGHREFVSRICVLASRPEILISGGGDDDVFVWEWERAECVSKLDLKALVKNVKEVDRIAVSGIYDVKQGDEGVDNVVVTVEGVPALFLFHLTPDKTLEHVKTLYTAGNVLSLAIMGQRLIVSVDNIHKSGSMTERRNEMIHPFQIFSFKEQTLAEDDIHKLANAEKNELKEESLGSARNLLYGLENLRKRDGEGRSKEGEDGTIEGAAMDEDIPATPREETCKTVVL